MIRSIIIMMVYGAANLVAQTSLTLTDQLPPYLLSAVLLNNGHFAVSTGHTGTPKTIIYREDGTGNRPVNYTSHIHVRLTTSSSSFRLNPISLLMLRPTHSLASDEDVS
ncbi:MAG: hypothetical protein IPF59_14070 [Ignavibacteria bacterium]|nr:hypothetical protein [Ignavibacteria bacterium]